MKLICIGLSILACVCAQAPSAEYLPPGANYGASASNVIENNFLDSEPYNTLANDGYRYRTVRRFRLRHRRDVNELSSGYLPPQASAPEPAYSVSSPYDNSGAYSVPAPVYTAPSTVYDASYDAAASEPAHIVAADGYRYKTVKRYRLRQRRRRDVSELASGYLPPQASAPEPTYSAPVSYENSGVYSAPNPVYTAPTPVYDASYDSAASEPAHIVAADGYRYKTVKRYRLRQRRRRDVSELASGYLPPQASAPEPTYSAPASYENVGAYSAPSSVYSAPVQNNDLSYDVAASAPAHSLASDGYRYRTIKRYRYRHRH
ncbi:uncharacterized protein LOC128856109 [Anastrepha ludens]|uniref:uncharacterized protein LOC128856109 n=1 Tax=Anastrepha ludens TaxID=28586 RepID=UPI0023AFC160|nr:uncharacterized protein LOC128856109 [Anastrepha ludens]